MSKMPSASLRKKRGILPASSVLPRGLINPALRSSSRPSGRRSSSFPPVPCNRSRVNPALSFLPPDGIKRCVNPSWSDLLEDDDDDVGTIKPSCCLPIAFRRRFLLEATVAPVFHASAQATQVTSIAFRDLPAFHQ